MSLLFNDRPQFPHSRGSSLRGVLLRPESGSHPSPPPSQPPGSGAEPSKLAVYVVEAIEAAVEMWRRGEVTFDSLVPTAAARKDWTAADYEEAIKRHYRSYLP